MSDRAAGFLVTMSEDLPEDGAERLQSALLLLHGVADVSPVQGDAQSLLGAMREQARWRDALLGLVRDGIR